MPAPVNPDEDCGGCIDRPGQAGAQWHRRRGQEMCETARVKNNRYKREVWAVSQVQKAWVPGTSILVPEVDPL